MKKATIGIDIAKARHEALLLFNGKQVRISFKNNKAGFDKFDAWIQMKQKKLGFQTLHLAMEATGVYYEQLAEYLVDQNYAVSVINPAQISSFAKSKLSRGKTDKADAYLIAEFCKDRTPRFWQPLPAEIKELQALTRYIEDLQKTRQEQCNRLEAARSPRVRTLLETLIEELDQKIKQVHVLIQQHLDEHSELEHKVELLKTIPGIAFLTAVRLLSEVPPALWASSARSVGAFSGLTPRPFESGESVYKRPKMCKTGSARLRQYLYMPAMVARQHNPLLKAFADRLEAAGKSKMSVLGAVMRKLLHIAFGVLKHGQDFDANWHKKVTLSA